MMRSKARTPINTLRPKGKGAWFKIPRLVSLAAKVTARTGKSPLTIAVPSRVMHILLTQRRVLEVLSWRRGDKDSQIATVIKILRKAASLMNDSLAMTAK
jgi:hypothetical protein